MSPNSPNSKKMSLFVTGEEIFELLRILPGQLIHLVERAEDPEQSEVKIYQKSYKAHYLNNLDFHELFEFNFVYPPPRWLHINNLRKILKNREPRGILFLLDPTKPVGHYQALVERLFNYLIDSLVDEFDSTGPYDIPVIFGVILVKFDAINFNFRAAHQFLQRLYPLLYRYTDRLTQTTWFEGVYTPHVDAQIEVRRIFDKSVSLFMKPKSDEELSQLDQFYKEKLKNTLTDITENNVPELSLKFFEDKISASSAWILRTLRDILGTNEFPYKLLGTKIIAMNLSIINSEITRIEEEIEYLTKNKPKSTGILNYLIDRLQTLKIIVEDGKQIKMFLDEESDPVIEKIFMLKFNF
ncbi:MAG: hypothetical protein ACW967_06315 [Candidatus Hodarchaeales archaeon]